jgi:4-alpha-glucanotransferase
VSDRANAFKTGRHAGLLLPLFSAPGRSSWGIGELRDWPVLASWLSAAGLDFVQVLPLNEMAPDQHSPYSAVSAMAIDPIYVTVPAVPEFVAAGGEQALPADLRAQLATIRDAERIEYNAVRALKMKALRTAYDHFVEHDWRQDSKRADALRAFLQREDSWVTDYALFRALREQYALKPWWEWDAPLARRDSAALAEARQVLFYEWLFFAYVQWLADSQWREARDAAGPIGVIGDLPFMVGSDSADVWVQQHAFRLDATVGAPPDAFSETGQDWGLPAYRWDVFEAEGDQWIRARARRNAALFDGYRVDHLVGFYRTYVIPAAGGEGDFSPADEPAQLALGERVMAAFLESGARVIAEDLGTVPAFVRESILRLGIAGYKVLRWEREWDAEGQPFRDPEQYPSTSVATTGTHDTETLVEWWESAPDDERQLVSTIPFLERRQFSGTEAACDPATRDVLLELLVASTSDLLILPVQDVFGWRDRINVPGTVAEENWTWRLPWPVEDLLTEPEAVERAATLRGWMKAYQRSGALFSNSAEAPSAVKAR